MTKFRTLIVLFVLPLVPSCTSTGSVGNTVSCYQTAQGQVCVETQGISTDPQDVDGDGVPDPFVCVDDDSADDEGDKDSDGVADAEDLDDDDDGIEDSVDTDDDDDGIDDSIDCDDYEDEDDNGVDDDDEAEDESDSSDSSDELPA